MERNKKTALLVLLAVLQVLIVRMEDCPDQPDKNLTCYTDYIRYITCAWNSAYEHTEAPCTLHAKRVNSKRTYSASCDLEPAHVSRPALRKCTMDFGRDGIFQTFHELSIRLSCAPAKHILTISYKPVCHIKLDPPGKPAINGTTASWLSEVNQYTVIQLYSAQLQWKRHDQSWSDSSVQNKQTKSKKCERQCNAQLDEDLLTLEEEHKARVRVKSDMNWGASTWSEWSPTASWVFTVGIARPPSGLTGGILTMIIVGAALASILAVMLFRTEKASWVYGKFRGPDPGKSFLKDVNFQDWLSPHFTNESFLSMKVEDISSVEVISSVDAATLCSKDAVLLAKMRSENICQLTSSRFLNPSYSHRCPPPPFPLPTAANLQPSDTPHGARHSPRDGKNAEQDIEEERVKALEMLQLLSKGSNNSEPLPVVSDYEKVEKLQVECLRLQSLDSGMFSCEELSQESLEVDNISPNESHDKAPEEREGGSGIVDFHKLFAGSGSVFGKGSIQVCSDYEQVQKLQPESPELPSLDSGVSSGGEERVSHEESLEDADKTSESTHFLFPPPLASSALPRSGISFPQQPLKFSGLSPSPSLRPSGDGYMPAKQEPC